MASIIEAYDSTMKEAFTGIKLFLWAIPISWALSGNTALNSFLGFFVTLAHNVVEKKQNIVPGLNFLEMAINGGLALVAVLPYAVVGALIYWASSLIPLTGFPVWEMTLRVVAGLLGAGFAFTALAIFIRRLNIIETYNVKKFYDGFMEVFLGMSGFIVYKLSIVSIVVIGFLAYLFSLFVGFENTFWTYIISIVYFFFVLLGANYLAQISEEVYTFAENEEAKKAEMEKFNKIVAEHDKK